MMGYREIVSALSFFTVRHETPQEIHHSVPHSVPVAGASSISSTGNVFPPDKSLPKMADTFYAQLWASCTFNKTRCQL